MNTWLVVIIILLLVAFWFYNSNSQRKLRLRKRYNKVVGYERSKNVEDAISEALKKEDEFQKKRRRRKTRRNDLQDAIMTSFMLGDLYRFNTDAPKTTAAAYYKRTIDRIVEDPLLVVDNDLPPEFMIDRVEEYFGELPLIGIPQEYFPAVRQTVRQARVQLTKHSQKGYYETRNVPSDPQNVHEPLVTEGMKQIYQRIVDKNRVESQLNPTSYNLEQIRDRLMKHPFSQEKRERALQILNKISEGNTISKLDTTEDQVLLNIWARINSADNKEKKQNLIGSLFDTLVDSMEYDYNGRLHEVCIGGRCSRLVSSLTLLDNDSEIAKPMKTTEILRNEVFAKSHKIIENELEKASSDVAKAYRGEIKDPPPELTKKVEHFEDHLRKTINETIISEYSDTKPNILDTIIQDAMAGV